jgi:hypothetical protein
MQFMSDSETCRKQFSCLNGTNHFFADSDLPLKCMTPPQQK